QNEPKAGTPRPHRCKGLEEARVVLVLPRERRVEEETLPRLVARPEPLVVESEVDGPHPSRVEPEPLDQAPGCVLRDRDHDPAAAHRPAVDDAPVRELRAGEELRIELVLDVE